jgi:uncharacterized protein YecE (DUF72 family)
MVRKEKFIGTSGYSYPYWKNRFYPQKLPASQQLNFYNAVFNTVELNYTFYRFPTVINLQKAASQTYDNFRFSVKIHKTITHTLRMQNAKEKINEFIDIITEGLGDKLGCVLYQLPPSFSYSEERLDNILNCVKHNSSNIIEFRHASWWQEKVYDSLRQSNLTFCSVSYPGLPDEDIITSDIFYKRMHGIPELFKSPYDETTLITLAKRIPENITSFVYFNNTMYEAGYSNAAFLKTLLND